MNTSFRKLMLALAISTFLVGSACGAWKVGDKLPPLSGFGLGGVLPANLAGKAVLIDFWASWCGPCKKSFPVLENLHQKYASQGLILLAINVDEDDAKMKQFLKDHPSTFPIVRDSSQKIVEAAGVEAMPTSFLVDAGGVIRFVHTGFQEESTPAALTTEIESLLGKGIEAKP